MKNNISDFLGDRIVLSVKDFKKETDYENVSTREFNKMLKQNFLPFDTIRLTDNKLFIVNPKYNTELVQWFGTKVKYHEAVPVEIKKALLKTSPTLE